MNPSRSETAPVPTWVLWSISLLLGVAASWSLMAWGATREASFMAGIFVLAAALWVTEALPLFATSLLVIGLQALVIANPGGWAWLGFESGTSPSYRGILSTAADPVLVLFFGGFVLAQAAVKEGVDRAISGLLLRPFGGHPRFVLLGVMTVTLMFGLWMSNTSTAAMMLALVAPMVAAIPRGDPFRKALVLAVPLTANISGMGTPISSPPNAVALGFLRQSGYSVAFLDWMLVAIPIVLGLTLFTWLILWKFFSPATTGLQLQAPAEKLSPRGWFVVVVFTVTVLLWMTDRWHGLPSAVVALLPAVVLTTTRIFTREDLASIEWSVLILIAGGISLGAGMELTGLDKLVASWLPSAAGNADWLLLSLVLATWIVGTFMSNTAAATLFLPIGLSSAALAASGTEPLHPIQISLSIALAASMSMALPISTPPNAMAYARGEFTTRDLTQVGIIIGGVAVVAIIIAGGFVMRFWGLLD